MKTAKLIVFGLLVAQSAGATGLGLGDLVSLAEKDNFGVNESRIGSSRAESNFVQSRASLLPKLLIESSASYTGRDNSVNGDTLPGQTWGSSASLVLRQNFYDGGQNWTAFERSQLSRSQARLTEKLARESMTLAVLRAFSECSHLDRIRLASKRKLDLLEQQFELARRQYRQGRKTQRDYQLLEAEVERSRLELEGLDSNIFAAYRELEKVVGASSAGIRSLEARHDNRGKNSFFENLDRCRRGVGREV